MEFITNIIPSDTANDRRPGEFMEPTTLTIHSTGNEKSNALGERAWLTNPTNDRTASYNMVVDDCRAVEVLPTGLKGIFEDTQRCEHGWHSGDGKGATSGNMTSLSIEICESGDREKTFQNAILLSAMVLTENGWGVDRMRQHYDWSKKNCPRILRDTGRWEWFVASVEAKLKELNGEGEHMIQKCDADQILAILGNYWEQMSGNTEAQEYTHYLANEVRKASGQEPAN